MATTWAAAAVLLYLVWFALAFGMRSQIQKRRTGDAGFRWPPGRPGSLEWAVGICFALALVAGFAAPLAAVAGLDELHLLDVPAVRWCGAVLAAIGILLTSLAQASMGDSWRVGVDENERTELVTEGPFALARNPIFTAMFVTAVGLAAMVPNVIAMTGLVGLAAALEAQVRLVEERYLVGAHGGEYLHYARRVGRFVPVIGRLRRDGV